MKETKAACHLCCGEEDFVRDVAYAAGDDPQGHPRENVGVVALAGVELPAIRQGHGVKRTPAGKNAPPLKQRSHNVSTAWLGYSHGVA